MCELLDILKFYVTSAEGALHKSANLFYLQQFHRFNYIFLFYFSDVVLDGRDLYAMNVWCIQAVDMATAKTWHGNANATRIGVAFYAIKVSYFAVVYLNFI